MGFCNITDKELSDALDITVDRLVDICELFESDAADDWELVAGVHFEWGPFGARSFSAEGAVEICNYLEENQEERPLFKRFTRWVFQRDRKLKGLMVAKRVQEISQQDGQIIFRNGRAFLAPRACRAVLGLGTRQDILKRTFHEIQSCEREDLPALKIELDFITPEKDVLFFSGNGLAVVGRHLGVRFSQKHRREWAKVVADYAPPALEVIEKHESEREKRIKRAMERVRKNAKGRCQLTNRRQSVGKFDLEVHHLFDKNTHPKLADMEVNLIAISSDVHTHFHQWMGGNHVTCTVEDMERFIEEFGHSLFPGKNTENTEQATKVAITLSNAKKMLKPLL